MTNNIKKLLDMQNSFFEWLATQPELSLIIELVNPWTCDNEKIAKFVKCTNWELFLSLGKLHGLLPLISRNIDRAKIFMPKQVVGQLEVAARKHSFSQLLVASELRAITQLLEDSLIPYVVLKGLPLANQYYGDINLRMVRDNDLLINSGDGEKICKLLQEQGWKLLANKHKLSALDYLKLNKQIELERNGVMLEVHISIGYYSRELSFHDIESRIQIANVLNFQCAVFSQSFDAIYICQHACGHGFGRLKWLLDCCYALMAASTIDRARALSKDEVVVASVTAATFFGIKDELVAPISSGALQKIASVFWVMQNKGPSNIYLPKRQSLLNLLTVASHVEVLMGGSWLLSSWRVVKRVATRLCMQCKKTANR